MHPGVVREGSLDPGENQVHRIIVHAHGSLGKHLDDGPVDAGGQYIAVVEFGPAAFSDVGHEELARGLIRAPEVFQGCQCHFPSQHIFPFALYLKSDPLGHGPQLIPISNLVVRYLALGNGQQDVGDVPAMVRVG